MPKELNPNARVHWAKKNDVFQKYKTAVWALTKEANLAPVKGDRVLLNICFYKPNNIRRDRDNMLFAFKAGFDGISLAIGIDDSKFIWTVDVADKIGGYVEVNFNYEGK